MSESSPASEIHPIQIIEDSLPDLLAATDVNSLRGAMASAEYLSQNTEPNLQTDLLVHHTAELLQQAELENTRPLAQEKNIFKRIGCSLERKCITSRSRALAYVAFAGHRVETSPYEVSFYELERSFHNAFNAIGRIDKGIVRGEIIKYCRGLAHKEEPLTRNEYTAVMMGRRVISHTTMNPFQLTRIASYKRTNELINTPVAKQPVRQP